MTVALFSDQLRALGVAHGFSLRTGGVSAPPFDTLNLGEAPGEDPASVRENLRRFGTFAGIAPSALGQAHQVHGRRVVHVRAGAGGAARSARPGGEPEERCEADALVAAPGAAAGVRTADCVPILLFDPRSGAAAAVHAGWRGTAAQVVVAAVEELVRVYDTHPPDVVAAIGPAIGRCCYEVGEDLAARFESDPAFGADVVQRTSGRPPRLDLFEANRRLLVAVAGLSAARVERVAGCTACEPARFFSHRRDQGRTGRHLAAIAAGPV